MGFFKSSMPMCPSNQHCSQWARKYMEYCLCSVKDGTSLTLGVISIISWGVAEIPQIVTTYREKSSEGLSIAFLLTWIVGDLFNLFGCMMEPATLPTQYYTAVLYTVTTMILAAQAIYYGHIYHQLKYNKQQNKVPKPNKAVAPVKVGQSDSDVGTKQVNDADTFGGGISSPIPLPVLTQKSSPGRELYYMSARSLSRSHTPTAGSFLAQRMTPTSPHVQNSIEEPLLGGHVSTKSAPRIKTTLCVVSAMTFLGTFNLHHSVDNKLYGVENPNQGVVMQVGRKLFQVSGKRMGGNANEGIGGIGSFLGWAMAVTYMGGRLPQICLNIKRGNVEGLNPLMFIFALVGNATYVASILVNSSDWSRIRPNLPWLVDAGGCVLLDTFILLQFIYFHHYRTPHNKENKHGHCNAA